MSFFDLIKDMTNNMVGDNYRKIYFDHYPQRYQNCKCCGKRLDRQVPREMTIDHIIPQKYGGSNNIMNLQVLCQTCNSKKSADINLMTAKYSGEALVREIRRKCRF